MITVRQLLAQARPMLEDAFEAEGLLVHQLAKPRSWLIAHAEDAIDDERQASYLALVQRRVQGEPFAYLVGRRGFWSLDLEVTPATLIPRPETELLVELALQHLPANEPASVLDLGTGSGAIALALARERPRWRITATDASADALAVAQRNALRLQLGQVRFLQGDWLTPLGDQQFSMIVSNPPYIQAHDPHLARGDLRFEPASALASGLDGLDDIRRIVVGARQHLQALGWLMFEHGWNQGDAARELLRRAGYRDVFTAKDLESRDRVSGGRYG